MIIEQLKAAVIIPVLRKVPYEKSKEIVQALYNGGIRVIEVTMESDRAELIIKEALEVFGDKMLIGAGTVLTIEDCNRAIEAGAQFIVSPALDEAVVACAVEHDVPVIPGVFTPSEMINAHQAGAAMVKLFPSSVLGPAFIKDVKGPLSHIEIMTTGGITKDTAKSYLDAGAIAVGAGSALLRKDLIEENDWTGLANEVKEWLEVIR